MPLVTDQASGVELYDMPVSSVNTLAALRNFPPSDNPNWSLRAEMTVVGSNSAFDGDLYKYVWNPLSAAAQSVPNVIKPTAITGAGRWILLSSNTGGGGGGGWLTGNGNPNTLGEVGTSEGQRYYNQDGSCGVFYWTGTDWC